MNFKPAWTLKMRFWGKVCVLGLCAFLGNGTVGAQQSLDTAQTLNDWAMIEKEYKALRADRDNILAQVKVAYDERSQAFADLEKAKAQLSQVQVEKEDLQKRLADFEKSKFAIDEKAADYELEIQDLKAQVESVQEKNRQLLLENQELLDRPMTVQDHNAKTPQSLMEAVRDRDRLLRENADLHYNLGVMLTKNRDYKNAVIEFSRAVQLKPTDAAAHFNLGKIHADYLNDKAKAADYFQEYLRLNPEAEDRSWVEGFIATVKAIKGEAKLI